VTYADEEPASFRTAGVESSKVIDVAAKVGFWHVVPPARITARPAL
jgi:hypothetical protein